MPSSSSSPDMVGGFVGWSCASFCRNSPGSKLGKRPITFIGSEEEVHRRNQSCDHSSLFLRTIKLNILNVLSFISK